MPWDYLVILLGRDPLVPWCLPSSTFTIQHSTSKFKVWTFESYLTLGMRPRYISNRMSAVMSTMFFYFSSLSREESIRGIGVYNFIRYTRRVENGCILRKRNIKFAFILRQRALICLGSVNRTGQFMQFNFHILARLSIHAPSTNYTTISIYIHSRPNPIHSPFKYHAHAMPSQCHTYSQRKHVYMYKRSNKQQTTTSLKGLCGI